MFTKKKRFATNRIWRNSKIFELVRSKYCYAQIILKWRKRKRKQNPSKSDGGDDEGTEDGGSSFSAHSLGMLFEIPGSVQAPSRLDKTSAGESFTVEKSNVFIVDAPFGIAESYESYHELMESVPEGDGGEIRHQFPSRVKLANHGGGGGARGDSLLIKNPEIDHVTVFFDGEPAPGGFGSATFAIKDSPRGADSVQFTCVKRWKTSDMIRRKTKSGSGTACSATGSTGAAGPLYFDMLL